MFLSDGSYGLVAGVAADREVDEVAVEGLVTFPRRLVCVLRRGFDALSGRTMTVLTLPCSMLGAL